MTRPFGYGRALTLDNTSMVNFVHHPLHDTDNLLFTFDLKGIPFAGFQVTNRRRETAA
jgi:hypothetical protein